MKTESITKSLHVCAGCEIDNGGTSELQDLAAERLEKLKKGHVSSIEKIKASAQWLHQSGKEFSQCSNCKYPVSYWWGMSNYCPNCGEKMEKKCYELN